SLSSSSSRHALFLWGGPRAGTDAPVDGGDPGPRGRPHRRHPGERSNARLPGARALADDRSPDPEEVEPAAGRGRETGRRDVPVAPGAGREPAPESGAPPDSGGVDAQLPAGGPLRRGRTVPGGARGARAGGRSPDGDEPARQRRLAAEGSGPAG